jgi:hypothetical protein
VSGQAGQAPGVVKARLSGAPEDVEYLARFLAGGGILAGEDIEVLDQSAPYPNRRDPGERVYLTVRVTAGCQR